MREFACNATFGIGDDESIVRSVFTQAEQHPARVLFSRPVGTGWQDVTAAGFAELVTGVAKGLIAEGVAPGDRVILLAATRFEWTLLDFAIWAAGAVTVPIYDSSSSDQVHWIASDSAAVLAVVETGDHAALFDRTDLPEALHKIVTIDDGAVDALVAAGVGVPEADLTARLDGVRADAPASLVYTSGTTGRPKGCVLTHRNFLAEVRGILTSSIGRTAAYPGRRILTFLPLAHVLARAVSLAAFEAGATQAHWSDFKTITGQFARFAPHTILGVPRVFEKVRDAAAKQAETGGAAKARIFAFAERTAIRYSQAQDGPRSVPVGLKLQHTLCDRLVYAKLRAALGGSCEVTISGGGALADRIGHFFRGLGVPIYEGYGLTETTAAHCVNMPGAQRIGTVGRPLGGNSVRIAEDGEIELGGGVVFGGYWNNEAATADALYDGWLRTGDLGRLDEDGYLRITGRKKDLLITAGGKNVAPGPMEDRLRSHTLVSQAVVVGDGRPFIGALLTVDPETFDDWKSAHGKAADATIAHLRADADLLSELQLAVEDANSGVSHAESIKKFVVLERDLTEESGELTPTLKVKRHVVAERFADEIDGLYVR
ncbi:long-chain fatty acid--CoA ligase [Rhodococcus sp. D2-41]|uniref:Acyl-CoA synthetase n=1 Tax=Speluncibacter jeojiensis TaxID=2710754 RepID=A0A9X4RE44_9ACTN|nr:long-chain fatty acid--CoA ligase [Rhodococcus sp. D2-41]MDG3012662.1 long-chain fatty acid--CoA ligase [Rhodococcus sp. D2-41]MDG3015233.1 long-chain fatty acid--CoA ligase [Corynebacteriales bacterium D3-21]